MKFLSNLRNRLRARLLKNNRGQGATEYILLVAVVVAVVMMFRKNIQSKLNDTVNKVGSQIDEAATPVQ